MTSSSAGPAGSGDQPPAGDRPGPSSKESESDRKKRRRAEEVTEQTEARRHRERDAQHDRRLIAAEKSNKKKAQAKARDAKFKEKGRNPNDQTPEQNKRRRKEEPADSPLKSRPDIAAQRKQAEITKNQRDARLQQAPARQEQRKQAHDEEHDKRLAAQGWNTMPEQELSEQKEEFPGAVVPPPIDVKLLTEKQVVCVVCDEWTLPFAEHCKVWPIERFTNEGVRKKLAVAGVVPPLPQKVVDEYDLSDLDVRLAGLLLSKNKLAQRLVPKEQAPVVALAPSAGAVSDGPVAAALDASSSGPGQAPQAGPVPENETHLNVCDSCSRVLQGEGKNPPANAIANNNAIGSLPVDLQDASWAELSLSGICYSRACIMVLKGGGQRAIRGHVMTVEMDPSVIATTCRTSRLTRPSAW
ncbi:MAG: hypothetical protein P4L81_00030 [Candidatus Pacebacteria bacterium]|nr:hypothetical protein [Candidatus Paceibacterota bacterium]